MADAYRIAWRLLSFLGRPIAFWPVVLLLLFLYGMQGHPTDALPSLFVWGLVVGTANRAAWLLPAPARQSIVPGDKPLPPPKRAVSITPTAVEPDCPPLAAMLERLPPELRRLVR